MIKNERLDEIMEILSKEKYATPDGLAKRLYVSAATIRRDLKKLEQDGLVNTCYGGVSVANAETQDIPLALRENFNENIKSALSKQAVKLIPEGSTVFLDASSTASRIAALLKPEQNVVVVTNGVQTLNILSRRHIKAYCTGGKLVDNSFALVGPVALYAIKNMYADFMFFSSQGIDEYGNITDFSESQTELRQAMLERARSRYFLCDNSKVGKRCLIHVCHSSQLEGVICDIPLSFSGSGAADAAEPTPSENTLPD